VHLTYDLFYQEYPVFFQHLKLHYNKLGFVDYLTSTLSESIEVPVLPERHFWEEDKHRAASVLLGRKTFSGISRGQLGLWLDEEKGRAVWAYDVEAVPKGPEMGKRGMVSLENPRVLEEREMVRYWREPENERTTRNLKVFTPYPAELSGGNTGPGAVTINSSGSLENEYVHVQFDHLPGGLDTLTEIDQDTTGISYTLNPSTYQSSCGASDTACPNQRVDSGNVFYHLGEYREWLKLKANTLGTTLQFRYDPLRVIVNYMIKAVEKTCKDNVTPISATGQANNAAYLGGFCDDEGTIDHCLVFFRYGNDSPCAQGANPGGSFAREALIIVHEYQHYVTDMISGIEFGSKKSIRVGDAIHEGYSDYFGATYALQKALVETPSLTDSQKTTISTVGGYAFREDAKSYRRNLESKKVFSPSISYDEPHTPGWVWGSALWELRDRIGNSTLVDLIALKSLYYLSTTPGFIDSVEALVQADKSITGGRNEATIRTLFFDERKFLGSLGQAFQDGDKKILKVGFQGCANVTPQPTDSSFPTLAIFLLWLGTTLWGGKRLWKNR
ncbi:MAG: M36 family metallopeptidase, partial [Pseudomonadota bacterium]